MVKRGLYCDCNVIHGEVLENVQKKMLSVRELKKMAKLLKVCGDNTRMNILSALNIHEMCVCDLAVLLNMTKSAISHQLRVLRDNDLVSFSKKGKHVYYSLADKHVKDILDIALEHINE